MDHSWRPLPIQGNSFCPTCSVSHFPFCPPRPHPPRFPAPNFEPSRGPMNMGRSFFNNYPDPYHDPGHESRNPNMPPQIGDSGIGNNGGFGYGVHGSGFVGGEYNHNRYDNNVSDDRSSKRLRVDGLYPGSYGSGTDANLSKPMGHGVPNSGFGFDVGLRKYPHESSGFDRNVNGRELGNSRMSNGVGSGLHYRKEELEHRSGHGAGYNMDRNVSNVEHGCFSNEYQSHSHQGGPHGQVATPPNPGSFSHGGFGHDNDRQSYGYRPPNYGSNLEHMQSNGAVTNYDKRSHFVTTDGYSNTHPPFPTKMTQPGHTGYGYHSPNHFGGVRLPIDSRPPPFEGYQGRINQNAPTPPPFVPPHMSKQIEYGNPVSEHFGHLQPPQGLGFQPPLPSSPPPPLPKEPPVPWSTEHKSSSSPRKESLSLFPVYNRSSAAVDYSHAPTPNSHGRGNSHLDNFKISHASRGTFHGDSQGTVTSFGQYPRASQPLPLKNNPLDKPRTIDAVHLFKQPHRTSRPDHFVIILRGLPGSGKSYFAKMLRDLELEQGGKSPRIHSMDDYFMTEVEKTEENDASKPLSRGKKPVTKTVIEFCYEPEMEEAYRSSMLKSFKETLKEGVYAFVIVDDRNLRVADFAQFWATAKRSGYEAYVLEAPYKDPAGCTARNVHGFTQEVVAKMAAQWEETPSLYLQLDIKSLLHGDDLKEGNIEEVDMDMEDEDFDASLSNCDERQAEKTPWTGNLRSDASPKDERNSDAENAKPAEEVKNLGRSKWSDDLDDDGDEGTGLLKGKANVPSGLLRTYAKDGKSVHWGDQNGSSGFSIGAANKAKMASLVIGPGSGYNLKSNPLPDKDEISGKSVETKKHSVFKERLQAERESFRAVFNRRRQRIGGVLTEEE